MANIQITWQEYLNKIKELNEAEVLFKMYKVTGHLGYRTANAISSITGENISIALTPNKLTITYPSGNVLTWIDDGQPIPPPTMSNIVVINGVTYEIINS